MAIRVMGIDPGLVETGYALLEGRRPGVAVVDSGVVRTRGSDPLDERLETLYDRISYLFAQHRPQCLAIEDIYAETAFPKTAILMGHARGVICLAARQQKIAVLALGPREMKRAVAASGNASKAQIQRAVQYHLHLPSLPRPHHVADALALALTGCWRLGVRISA